MKKIFVSAAACLTLVPLCGQGEASAQEAAIRFRSTSGNYWKMSTAALADKASGTAQVTIRTNAPQQTFNGWGTCFNELPWDAYNMLDETQQQLFARRLFNPDGDLRLTVGRIPVGASDYGRDWYSCDEYEGDFAMEHFNIDRDLTTVIPSIKVAQAQNPNMTFWASPWSPPQWMKTNKHYAQRKTNTNGCPFSVAPYDNDQFIDSAKYYDAYCLYFSKFIDAYREQGIPITALAYQNEAYSNTPYPGCSWTAKTTGKFLGQYLGPYMSEHQPGVKLIVGTMNTNHLDVFNTILNSEGVSQYCSMIGFQWEGGQVINTVQSQYPGYEMVMTESECGSGTFDWAAAAHTFQLVNHYLANRVTTYTYWNAILKDRGVSTWGWVQNALVQVSSSTKQPRYTAEYYAYKHYTHLIPPGSKILTCDESNLLVSALRPDGNVVVVIGNNGTSDKTLTIDIDGKYLVADVPVKSFTSYVIGSEESVKPVLASEARGLASIEKESLTDSQAKQLSSALATDTYDGLLAAVAAVEGTATASGYEGTTAEAASSSTETYYLYDATIGQFVNQKNKDTRTELSESPLLQLTVAKNGGYYNLLKTDKQYIKLGYYQGQFVWCDGKSGGAVDWTLKANGDGTYIICMEQDIVARDAAIAAGTYYLSGSNATTNEAAAHSYALVSKDGYAKYQARDIAVQAIPADLDMAQVAITYTTNGNWNGDHLDWMDVGTVAWYKIKATEGGDYTMSFKASSYKKNGATVNAKLIDSNDTEVLSADITIAHTADWDTFYDYTASLAGIAAGEYTLVLTFTAAAKSADNIEGTCNMKGLAITRATTGITAVNSNATAGTAATCNLAGQRVGKAYKGIVVAEGKKYINK